MDAKQKKLLERLKKDDRSALKELFKEYYKSVCASIYRLVKDKSIVEDLAQEVFLRFWNKRHTINVQQSIGAYLRRMAVNEALGFLRSRKITESDENIQLESQDKDANIEALVLHSELEDQIKQAIQNLPPRCKIVFILSRFEDLTYQEIANRMEISIKTVENQMGRALRLLRSQLKDYIGMTR